MPRTETVALLAEALGLTGDERAHFESVVRRARGGVPAAPPAPPAPSAATNLPTPLSSFIGREGEIARLLEVVTTSRLVTLTGPGGVGKTRLAQEVARRLTTEFTDGVWYVPLAAVRDAEVFVATVAQTLGLSEAPGRSLLGRLAELLRERRTLLVLDNFEQLLDAAPVVADLLSAAPRLTVLATSRAPLRVQGEREVQVPPLGLPSSAHPTDASALERYEAIRLFVERTRDVRADFALTDENAPAVAEICRRVDGLPLALELAAARMRLFPPTALLARLASALPLLTGGARDLPARQQTLRSAIAWSYDLLTTAEQRLFERLAVFVGGAAIAAVEAVCGPADELGLDPVDGLDTLVAQSLLRQDEVAGEPRVVMLETIREYALERLEASGEADALRLRHAAHYLTLAERAAEDLVGPAQAAAIAVLERDHGNLRAALRWAIESGDVGRSLRFGAALWRFWRRRGYLTEGRERLGETLALAERASVPPDRSIQAAWGRALNGAGGLAYFQGDYAQASALQEQSLATCRRLGETRGVATALNDLGRVARMQGDLTRAETLQLESLALQRELGDDASAAETLVGLGVVAYHRGDYPAARGRYEEALTILRRLGHQQGIAATLGNLGRVASLQRDHATARALLEESLEAFRAIGDRWSVAVALDNLGYAALLRGDRAEAERLFDECLTLRLELGGRQGIAEVMEGFAGVAAATDPRRAARLAGAAETLRTELTAPLGPVERTRLDDLLAPARAALGDQAFAAEWAAGTATPIADAIAVVQAGAA